MEQYWDEKAERLLQWFQEGKNAPYTLEIHPTFRCNLHCVFCAQEEWRQQGHVDFSTEISGKRWLKLIDDAARMGVKEVRLCGGGEPMFDLQVIVPLFKRIKQHGMTGYITTNGTMFTDELCKLLVDIGWDKIDFSIDGDNAETHDSLRGVPGSFERSVRAVRLICEHKRALKSNKPYVAVTPVVTKRNYAEIPGMARLFGPMGVDQILLLVLHPRGEQGLSLVVPPESEPALKQYISEAEQIAHESRMMVHSENLSPKCESRDTPAKPAVRSVEKPLEGNPELIHFLTLDCYEPWYYMQILHDGYYSPCCNSYFEKTSETLHHSSFEQLWLEGSHMRTVREDVTKGIFNDVCKECDAVNLIRTKELRKYLLDACEERNLLPTETIQHIRKHHV